MGGGGVCAGELRGKAWVGRGRGECRFVPALGNPVEPPPPPPQGAFLRLFLPLVPMFLSAASLFGCSYKYILH